MGETVTVRLFVCTQTYDIPCDPRQPAKWLLAQAKNIQRSTRHANNQSEDELEVLYNRTKRIVIDLAEPIGKSIAPMDVIDARTLLQTPDTSANAGALFPWLRSGANGKQTEGQITTSANGLFFQQLYAYTLIGRRTPQLPSQRRQLEKQEQYLELLKTYVCGSFPEEPQFDVFHGSYASFTSPQPKTPARSYVRPLAPNAPSPSSTSAQRVQARRASDFPPPPSIFSTSVKDTSPPPRRHTDQPQDRDSDSSGSDNVDTVAVTDTTSPPKRLHSNSYPPSTPSAAPAPLQRRPSASGSEVMLEDVDNVFDIVFKQQAIGMKLGSDESKQFAVVKECFEGSEAKRYPEIQNGVVILAVNGQEVSGLGLSRVLYRLREAPRPVVVRFGRIGKTTQSQSQSHSYSQSHRAIEPQPQSRSFWGS